MRILVVEDEGPIALVIQRGLQEAGFEVDIASDGAAALRKAEENRYGLFILDVMLPLLDGWDVCKRLRADRRLEPILMLTARDSMEDRVRGLDLGADDYLCKPFGFPELLARVRALLRRERVHKTRVIRIADLEIDTASRLVTRAGQEVSLTRREFALLEALATNEGRVLTRDIIQDEVWMNEESYSNTVDVHIGMLRRKLDQGHAIKLIQTVHGLGYMLKQVAAGGET